MITVEYSKVKRVDIEAGIEVVIEDVARRINVRAIVSRDLHLGVVGLRAVLHALRKPQKLAETVVGVPRGHVGSIPVTDIEDSAFIVEFSSHRYKVSNAGGVAGRVPAVGRGVRDGRGDDGID